MTDEPEDPKCPKCGADMASAVGRTTGIVRYKCMKMRMGCDFMGTREEIEAYKNRWNRFEGRRSTEGERPPG